MSDLAMFDLPSQPCDLAWDDPYVDLPGHITHRCVFTTRGPHTRHECRCGINRHEVHL